MRILVVEDDKYIAEALVYALTEQLFIVDIATDGLAGWQQAQTFDYDLILLDVMLPQLDGITLCRKLRKSKKSTPILLLTARDNSQDKVKGLDAGADDYVVKPFDIEELLARIRALLRRGNESVSPIKKWGNLCLNSQTCEVIYADQQLNLTPKEYGILNLFMHNRERVFSCSAILDKLWDLEDIPTEDTVRAHIKGLRQKLKAADAPPDLIETVYGLGYRLKQENHNLSTKKSNKNNQEQQVKSDLSKQKLQQSVAKIWDKCKDTIRDRINLLEQAAKAGKDGKLDSYLKQQAEQEAHKLVGSLGTFGFGYGSELAREIETLLMTETPLNSDEIADLSKLVIKLNSELNKNSIKQNNQNQNTAIKTIDIYSGKEPLSSSQKQHLQLKCQLLLILEKDSLLEQQLIKTAKTKNIECTIAQNNKLLTTLDSNTSDKLLYVNSQDLSLSPNIALLDLDIVSNYDKILEKLANKIPFVPVVVLNTHSKLSERIKIAKLGAAAYLQKPITATQIIDVVLNVWQQNYIQKTVMIVNNDAKILENFKDLLRDSGIKAVTLNDERNFWETLKNTVPELLILDIEMSHFNGINLCQVIRNDPHWSWLPIIFVTAHHNDQLRNQVFAVGADDYISKPLRNSELLTRIISRIKRNSKI